MKVKITLLLALTLLFSLQGRAQCNGATFEEENGIVVIQAESGNLSGAWQRQTSFSGYTGSSYIVWTGQEYFNTPGNGIINYTVRINSPGTYRFNWRTRIGIGNENTEHNDTWLRIQGADDFYGQRGNSRVYPRGSGKSPNPEGASANGWLKIYMNTLDWIWQARTSDFDPHEIYARFDNPGTYTIQVSARSRGHLIDRMVLYKESLYTENQAQNNGLAETRCDGTNNPPPPPPGDGGGDNDGPNTPPTVTITSPTNGQSITAGSNVTVQLTANDPDGSVVQHRIFVNGNLVDTDGAGYTPHIIQNITSGNYEITARVTDNDGATSESSVTISVGGTAPPPDDNGGDSGSGNAPPAVTITSPNNGQNFAVGANLSIQLSASDSDGSIVQHQIFVNGSLVDTDGSSYTPHPLQNVSAGNYEVTARVTDNDGAVSEDTVVFSVGDSGGNSGGGTGNENGLPSVTITSPTNGQNFTAGVTVSIQLSSSDADGSIVQHQIFVNGNLVDTDGSSYTPHPISNIGAGNYVVRAVVTDNDGNSAEDQVSFTVGDNGNPPPPANNVTFYLINANTDQVARSVEPGINIQFGEARNFQATTTVAGVGSARIQLSGALNSTRIESVAPYAAFGDVNGDYIPTNLPDGNYTLTATFYSGGNASGTQLASRSVSFSVGSGSNSGKTVVDLAKAVVYPNPVPDGQVTVKLPVPLQSTYAYQLMAPNGQIVDYGVKENASASDTSSLYLKGLEQSQEGIYYLTLTDGVHTFSVPVVKK